MDQAVREAGVKSVVSFVLRWNPMILSIKKAVEAGSIGRPLLVQAGYDGTARPIAGRSGFIVPTGNASKWVP